MSTLQPEASSAARDADLATATSLSNGSGVVGVLGGMGPLATVDFMHKVLLATSAQSDQDHVPMLVSSIPQIPDRTMAFRGQGPSPLPAMRACAQRLVAGGAEVLVMPCNTAHLWFDELCAGLPVPVLHMVDATLQDALERFGHQTRIGLLATDATLASGLYMNRGAERPSAAVRWLLPTASEMMEWVMPGIGAVKAGQLAQAQAWLRSAADALQTRGAEVLVLGCTEIPVALTPEVASLPVIDATHALARRAVAWSRARRRSETTDDCTQCA